MLPGWKELCYRQTGKIAGPIMEEKVAKVQKGERDLNRYVRKKAP